MAKIAEKCLIKTRGLSILVWQILTREELMFKELSMAVILTLIFSVGVGVLFVRTLIEMVELFFNSEIDAKEAHKETQA